MYSAERNFGIDSEFDRKRLSVASVSGILVTFSAGLQEPRPPSLESRQLALILATDTDIKPVSIKARF
jgi:hypothetical protein